MSYCHYLKTQQKKEIKMVDDMGNFYKIDKGERAVKQSHKVWKINCKVYGWNLHFFGFFLKSFSDLNSSNQFHDVGLVLNEMSLLKNVSAWNSWEFSKDS